ncbi:hypothetical protein [uncultured Campylobacter sp.]|uniref:hypothetical protein n=1 Tax=uncultured Campylobacter sp. TaxID=218934 RepID=UPI002614E3E5|nr:hypothetical protein [uncultured Campylobacter sp.]
MEFKIYSLCAAVFGAEGLAAERKILTRRKILTERGILATHGILKFKDASTR